MSSSHYLEAANPELQSYLRDHEHDDERLLVLTHRELYGVSSPVIADQLSGRRKAKRKIPTFYDTIGIVYPPSISMEQCSSELTARFKASLLSVNEHRIADLTGGFGVDAFFLSSVCAELDYVEADQTLMGIARHNHEKMAAINIRHYSNNAEKFLTESPGGYDLIYIDPSRRSPSGKVFRLAQCQPDVISLLPQLQRCSSRLMIKTSPLLDLRKGMEDLRNVDSIYVVAVGHECREVLFLCSQKSQPDPVVTGINLDSPGNEEFIFRFSEERSAESATHDPITYLYEPHAWILKAGAFKLVGSRFGAFKVHVNTHLYTSAQLLDNFPGRIFRIVKMDLKSSEMKTWFADGKANVMVRNYPLKPEELRKKFNLHDGGDKYLIGFTGLRKKFLVAAERIK